MARYVLKFSKEGYFKYTSHLDLLRLFKRSFKRAGIKLDYSEGFNPHPKMAFAQPLSLGYSSIGELIEFETLETIDTVMAETDMSAIMPEGLVILGCKEYKDSGKALAALVTEAKYLLSMPFTAGAFNGMSCKEAQEAFLAQDKIIVKKRQKKTNTLVDLDIKTKIIELEFVEVNHRVMVNTRLDAGSESNLNPELLIGAIREYFKMDIAKDDIDVMRKQILFSNDFSM